ncbi:DUF2199 domain-containing protein [Streptomyces drozdowiczii]
MYATTTLNLKTRVHTRPVGDRPFVELEPTDHPLAIEQRTAAWSACRRLRPPCSTLVTASSGDG